MAVVMQDVAKLAGVSPASVSRVLNNPEAVSEDVRRRVTEAVSRLQYSPNQTARSMRTKRSRSIGVLLPDISDPFFSELFRWIEKALAERGYIPVVCSSYEDDELELSLLRTMPLRAIDGLICASVSGSPANTEVLRQLAAERPVVLIDRSPEMVPATSVTIDNRHGMHLAVSHLVGLGHRSIAYVGATVHNQMQTERDGEFAAAALRLGASTRHEWVEHADFKAIAARLPGPALSFMAGDAATRPTAIVCSNDMVAIATIASLRAMGLSVPNDVSVTGFDDIVMASLMNPALTTIRQPIVEMAKEAADAIVRSIEDANAPIRTNVYRPELVIRASTALIGSGGAVPPG